MKFALSLKSRLLFNTFLQTNISYISGAHSPKSKCCFNAKPSAYSYTKAKMSVNFQIYISLPLRLISYEFLLLGLPQNCIVSQIQTIS